MDFKIAVLPGDGIGPEVMDEAVKVLKALERKFEIKFILKYGDLGGVAYDKHETPFPDITKKLCDESDAILLGSIGGPKWDGLKSEDTPEIGGLLALRKYLSLYANLRPVKLFNALKSNCPLSENVLLNKNIEILTVRELSSGIYFGEPKELSESLGFDTMVYKREEVEKIAEVAFNAAMARKKEIVSIDKANVLCSSKLWRNVVNSMNNKYPEVKVTHMYVDNAVMQLILDPSQFDVVLTSNLFGDIFSDETAAISGSLGLLPSASISEKINLYEPSGGSAPDLAGLNKANPIAQILSVAMMMEYSFKREDISRHIFKAVENVLTNGFRTVDIAGDTLPISTSDLGGRIIEQIILMD